MKNIKVTCTGADTVNLDDLAPFQGSLKTLSEDSFKKLRTSILKYGISFPFFVWKDQDKLHTLDGHQRDVVLKRMRQEGYEVPPVPVDYIEARNKKEAREKILLLSSQYGRMTEDSLADYIKESAIDLSDLLPVLDLQGIDISRLVGPETPPEAPEPQIDRAEELQDKRNVQTGDLWNVGRHRLLCGDCTVEVDVARLLVGSVPLLMVTDPPYGVEYDPEWRSRAAEAGYLSYAARRTGTVTNDDRMDWIPAWQLFPGDVAYIWHAGRYTGEVHKGIDVADFEVRNQIIWSKSNFPISRGHYHWKHESCFYAVKKGRTAHWVGDRKQTTVWEISLDTNIEGGHSTQKPLECMARPIRNHEGDVYDPFLGTGTTMCAAETLGRICYGMEIEPKYCAVILERMTEMGIKDIKKEDRTA